MAATPHAKPSAGPVGSAELFKQWQGSARSSCPGRADRALSPPGPQARAQIRSLERALDDLVQVASLGLVKAVERFDPERGFAFTSFAVPTIVGELKRYFRDTAWALHVDRSAQERARRIADARREIATRLGRTPTVVELAEYLECSAEEVLDGLQVGEAYDTLSLDAPRPADDGGTVSRLEAIGDDDERLALVDEQATISAAAAHLAKRERQILFLRFNEDLTQTEIAERVGVSQMQVSRLLRRSLQRLRDICL